MNKPSKPPRHLKGFYSRKIRAFHDSHRRLIRRGILGSVTALVIIFTAGFIPFSANMVRDKVVKVIEKSFADTCSIKRITLVPWLGFSIDSLVLSKKDNGTVMTATIPHVRMSYHIVPLLFRFVIIKNFAIERPNLHVMLPASRPVQKKEGKRLSATDLRTVLSGFPFSIVIRSVSVDNGAFTVERHGTSLVAASGIDASMKVSYAKSLVLEGKISGHSLRLAGLWNMTDLKAMLSVNDVYLKLSQCRSDFYGGTVDASGGADLGLGTLDGFHFELSHVNVKRLYEGSRIGQGECTGRLDGKLDIEESPLDPDSLSGRGEAAFSDLDVHDLPVQNSLVVLIAVPKIKSIRFSRFSTDLVVKNGRLFTPNMRGDGEPLGITADGWVGFDGYFSEQCDGIFSREFVGILPSIVERSLDDAGDGKKSFKCSILGTFKNPQLKVDRKIMNRAVHNVLDEVTKGLGRLFRK
jgi:AsmA-like C-terminal region